jgi:hypothetical protein
MSSWWQSGYPGGPMTAVKGFPRPLYWPGNPDGHKPSVDGPDVEAYKRTVSRAGRWVWQAFDQQYSKQFATGKPGGNVKDTGIAGVQRQLGIRDTGYVGEATMNGLRSIIIPAPLPHAGEHAMDARSVELINAAFDRFGGKEPPSGGETCARARLQKAQAELGNTEQPPNSNNTKYGQWYGMNGVPWCAIFCTWCDQNARPTKSFLRGSRYSYVPYMVSDARNALNGFTVTSTPQAGDLVCYDWQGDGEYDHVGIFESGNNQNWVAVEGNTSTSDNSNGGQVMRRTRSKNDAAVVFVRVAEP